MLYREIISVCSQIHTKHINTQCGQNVGLLIVKPGGIHSDHWALECCSSTLGTDGGDHNYYLTKNWNKQDSHLLAKHENLEFSKFRRYLILPDINFDATEW
jgi:hypothetical protein